MGLVGAVMAALSLSSLRDPKAHPAIIITPLIVVWPLLGRQMREMALQGITISEEGFLFNVRLCRRTIHYPDMRTMEITRAGVGRDRNCRLDITR